MATSASIPKLWCSCLKLHCRNWMLWESSCLLDLRQSDIWSGMLACLSVIWACVLLWLVNSLGGQIFSALNAANIFLPSFFTASTSAILFSKSCLPCLSEIWALITPTLWWRKPNSPSPCVVHRSYKKFNADKFREDLAAVPWSVSDVFDSVDDKVDFFDEILLKALDKHAPLRRIQVKKQGVPWVSRQIRDKMDQRVKLLRCFQRTGSTLDWESYRLQQNKVRTLLRNSKRDYLCGLIGS